MITRDVVLKVDSLKISGRLYLPGDLVPYPVVCLCHGIPAGISDPVDKGYPLLAEKICDEGLAVFFFNFRGIGASEGNLDLLGWTRDLTAALNYLYALPEVDRSRLALLGFSGGAAVSIYVASQDKRVSFVVSCACPADFDFSAESQSLLNHFRDIGLIRDKDFPPYIEEWFNNFRQVRPANYIAGIAPRPLLLMHGNHDEVVDINHLHKLYARAGEPKQMIIIDGAGHRLRLDEGAMSIAISWLKQRCQL